MPTKSALAVDGDKLSGKQLLTVLTSIKKGDFSARLPDFWSGIDGKIADTLNEIIELMAALEDRFKFSIDPETLSIEDLATVGSLIEYVRSRMHGR